MVLGRFLASLNGLKIGDPLREESLFFFVEKWDICNVADNIGQDVVL